MSNIRCSIHHPIARRAIWRGVLKAYARNRYYLGNDDRAKFYRSLKDASFEIGHFGDVRMGGATVRIRILPNTTDWKCGDTVRADLCIETTLYPDNIPQVSEVEVKDVKVSVWTTYPPMLSPQMGRPHA